MALSLEPKVYGSLSIPKTPNVRPQPRPAGGEGESTQRDAQAFVETLPSDVRERIAQLNRDGQKKNQFDDAQKAADQVDKNRPDEPNGAAKASLASEAPAPKPIYTAPILTPVATLLQAQLSEQGFANRGATPTSFERKTYHEAYLNAGAQPGGQASALEAALVREERADKILIVPPVLTNVNFVA